MGSWLATHFVNPAMLGALALVAVPIIIWLLSRFRYRTVEWAAQTFLLRAIKRSQRRLRLENLLLLLIRCLLIALFVAALARPRGRPIVLSDPNDARRNVVVLMDTSYSTGYQLGSDAQETVHEREKRAAKDLVRQLRPVDRLAVVAFDETARVVYPTPRTVDDRAKKDFQDDLESLPELQRSARGTDYSAALGALPGLLRRFDLTPDGQPPPSGTTPSPKTVFLLSDAQRSALLDVHGKLRDPNLRSTAEALKQLGAAVHIVDCGVEEPKNASITLLETREPIVGTDMPCIVEAAVKNWGASRARGLTFELYVDGAETPAKAQAVDLEAGEQRPLEPLRYVFHERGPHRVTARLKSDALVIDNERALVIDVRDAVNVLLVDGEPKSERWESETDFLRQTLTLFSDEAAGGRDIFRTETITESQLGPAAKLRGYDVVFLANVVSLEDEQIAALETYVKDGGSVVFSMGGLVDRNAYNEKLWRGGRGLLPCKLGEVRGPASSERPSSRDPNAPEWMMVLADREHPVLKVYASDEMRLVLRAPAVFRYVDTQDLGTGPLAASVPLRLAPRPRVDDANARPSPEEERSAKEGAPVLVEKAFGRGRGVAWLSTIDHAWTDFNAFDSYVIFWREVTLELARTSKPRKNLAVGERYERTITTAEYAPNVEVTLPDGAREVYRPEVIEGREQFRIAYPPSADAAAHPGSGHGEPPAPAAPQIARRAAETQGAEKPGLYEVRLTGGALAEGAAEPSRDWFAVRVDPQEGDTSKLGPEDWKEALPSMEAHTLRPEALAEAFAQPGEGTQANELWAPFVTAVVILLALESLLAALFGRRRR